MYGLVYFHQNTKEVFKEFPKTNDAKTLKHHQQFFLECIILIIVDDINVRNISITCILVLFSDVMDGFGSSFSPTNTACMLTASNKSSNNTVMRECVLDIVFLNDVSLELAKLFLTAS
jgi:hypothetical protein